MVNRKQLQDVADGPKLFEQAQGYLTYLGVEFTLEDNLIRLKKCPYKGRDSGDRSWIIVTQDYIVAGCHGAKCAGKGWVEMQEAFGLSFADYLKNTGQKVKKQKADPVSRMVKSAQNSDELFHTPDGQGYVQTIRRGCREVLAIRSKQYQNVLRLRYEKETGAIAKREHVSNAIEQLDAIAIELCEEYPVGVRVAEYDGAIYFALGDTNRRIIKVTKDGWEIDDNSPVKFRYSKSSQALPLPTKGGSLDQWWPCVNIKPEDRPLYAAFLVHFFNCRDPYTIMAVIGSPGQAKSTTVRNTQRLLDPSEVVGSAMARCDEDLLIGARERRLSTFDNLNHLTREMSDNLCRMSTGAAYSRRTKYSDCDETTFTARSPVIISAVSDVITQPDLYDRTLRFIAPPLPKTISENVIDDIVINVSPAVLGVILDGVVSALRNMENTIILDPPRMVGFALWGTAAEEGLGLPKGSVMESYRRNIGEVADLILESDLAQKIIGLANKGFKGRTKTLAKEIDWPTSASSCKALLSELRLLGPALAKRGIRIDPDKVLHGYKVVEIHTMDKAQWTRHNTRHLYQLLTVEDGIGIL